MKCYFFGTFNPVHIGHIEIARRVKDLFNFEKIVFVPSYIPPHKIIDVASFVHRFEMLKLSVGEESVSDIETKLKPPSYTFQTIQKLLEEDKTEKINFIIGYDQFFQIESWKNTEFLRDNLNFIVVPRHFKNGQVMGQKALEYLKNKGYKFETANIDFLDVSSDMVRKYVENNMEITGLVTKEVREYIEKFGLYKNLAQRKLIR